jgi:CheY-like chemotaxis protein
MAISRILVVDDSKSARMVLSKMLQNLDLTVDTAISGEEALSYLTTHHPDAIFMDHIMPGIDGLQAVMAIKENPLTAGIPIAMYTSKEKEAYGEEVKDQKIVGVLPKPATPGALSAILKELNVASQTVASQTAASQTAGFQTANVTKPPITTAGLAQSSISSVLLEDTVWTVAKAVIEDTLRQQIMPLFEEKLTTLREEVLAESKVITMEAIGKAYYDRSNQLSNKLQQLDIQIAELRKNLQVPKEIEIKLFAALKSRLKSIITETAHEMNEQAINKVSHIASEVYDIRSEAISKKIENHLKAQQLATKTSSVVDKVDPILLREITRIAQSTVADQAGKYSQITVGQMLNDNMKKIREELDQLTKFLLKRLSIFVILAIVFMILITVVNDYILK